MTVCACVCVWTGDAENDVASVRKQRQLFIILAPEANRHLFCFVSSVFRPVIITLHSARSPLSPLDVTTQISAVAIAPGQHLTLYFFPSTFVFHKFLWLLCRCFLLLWATLCICSCCCCFFFLLPACLPAVTEIHSAAASVTSLYGSVCVYVYMRLLVCVNKCESVSSHIPVASCSRYSSFALSLSAMLEWNFVVCRSDRLHSSISTLLLHSGTAVVVTATVNRNAL